MGSAWRRCNFLNGPAVRHLFGKAWLQGTRCRARGRPSALEHCAAKFRPETRGRAQFHRRILRNIRSAMLRSHHLEVKNDPYQRLRLATEQRRVPSTVHQQPMKIPSCKNPSPSAPIAVLAIPHHPAPPLAKGGDLQSWILLPFSTHNIAAKRACARIGVGTSKPAP